MVCLLTGNGVRASQILTEGDFGSTRPDEAATGWAATNPHLLTSVGTSRTFLGDPETIFTGTTGQFLYLRPRPSVDGGLSDTFQHVSIGAGSATHSANIGHRNDFLNRQGTIQLQLFSGHLTDFTSATPITPTTSSNPSGSLTGTLAASTDTYASLSAGNYTVRIFSQLTGSGDAQIAADDWSFDAQLIPEPSLVGLLVLGGFITGVQRKHLFSSI